MNLIEEHLGSLGDAVVKSYDGVVMLKDSYAGRRSAEFTLVIGHSRIHFLSVTGRKLRVVQNSIHMFDVRSVVSKDTIHIDFWGDGFSVHLQSNESDRILQDFLIQSQKITMGFPLAEKSTITIEPKNRKLRILKEDLYNIEISSLLGGFVDTYKAFCQKVNRPINHGFCDYVIQHSLFHNPRLLSLGSFPEVNDEEALPLEPVFLALQYNSWFEGIRIRDVEQRGIIKYLSIPFSKNDHIQSMEIVNYTRPIDGFGLLIKSIKKNKGLVLRHVNFTRVEKMTEKKLLAFFEALGKRVDEIVSLHLVSLKLTKRFTTKILKLFSASSKLRHIRLEGLGKITRGSSLASFFTRIPLVSVSLYNMGLKTIPDMNTKNIQVLNFGANKFSRGEILKLSATIIKCPMLRELHLRGMNLTTEIFLGLLQSFKLTQSKTVAIDFSENSFGFDKECEESFELLADPKYIGINLSGNDLNYDGLSFLLKKVARNPSLQILDISKNVPAESIQSPREFDALLAELLSTTKALHTLKISGGSRSKRIKCDLEGPEYAISDLDQAFWALEKNASLRLLDLSGNMLSEEALVKLFVHLEGNASVERIFLMGNRVGRTSLEKFLSLCYINNKITKSDLGDIETDAGRKIREQLEINYKVQKLLISGNIITKEVIDRSIRERLSKITSLISIDLANRITNHGAGLAYSPAGEAEAEGPLDDKQKKKVIRKMSTPQDGYDSVLIVNDVQFKPMPNKLIAAFYNKSIREVQKYYQKSNKYVFTVDERNGYTPIHYSCYRGSAEMLSLILSSGGDTFINKKSLEGYTPLHILLKSIHSLNKDCLILLIDYGINLNQTTSSGDTPITFLLSRSADVKDKTGRRLGILKILLDKGADPNKPEKSSGLTPLHIAAEHGLLPECVALVEYGADINALDYNEDTPIHKAVKRGNVGVFHYLIKRGAIPNVRNKYGEIPLEYVPVLGAKDARKFSRILNSRHIEYDKKEKYKFQKMHYGSHRAMPGNWRKFRESNYDWFWWGNNPQTAQESSDEDSDEEYLLPTRLRKLLLAPTDTIVIDGRAVEHLFESPGEVSIAYNSDSESIYDSEVIESESSETEDAEWSEILSQVRGDRVDNPMRALLLGARARNVIDFDPFRMATLLGSRPYTTVHILDPMRFLSRIDKSAVGDVLEIPTLAKTFVPTEYRTVNIVVIGPPGIGKSKYIRRYTRGTYSDEYNPTWSIQVHEKVIVDDRLGGEVIVDLWDVGGDLLADPVVQTLLLSIANGVVLVYDKGETLRLDPEVLETLRSDKVSIVVGFSHQNVPLDDFGRVELEKAAGSFGSDERVFVVDSKVGVNVAESVEHLVSLVVENEDRESLTAEAVSSTEVYRREARDLYERSRQKREEEISLRRIAAANMVQEYDEQENSSRVSQQERSEADNTVSSSETSYSHRRPRADSTSGWLTSQRTHGSTRSEKSNFLSMGAYDDLTPGFEPKSDYQSRRGAKSIGFEEVKQSYRNLFWFYSYLKYEYRENILVLFLALLEYREARSQDDLGISDGVFFLFCRKVYQDFFSESAVRWVDPETVGAASVSDLRDGLSIFADRPRRGEARKKMERALDAAFNQVEEHLAIEEFPRFKESNYFGHL